MIKRSKSNAQAGLEKNCRVYSPEYRAEMIAKYYSSGLTQSEFCRKHGVLPTTFHNWIHRSKKNNDVARDAANIPAPEFIPVKIVDSTDSKPEAANDQSSVATKAIPCSTPDLAPPPDIQVRLPSNCVVVVPHGFDSETLRRVVSVVG